MATAYENLIKHLKLAVRQLGQLKTRESCIDEDELLDSINALVLDLTV